MRHRTCSIAGCEGTHQARGLCPKHYFRWRRGRPVEADPMPLAERLRTRVRLGGPSGDCLEWTGALATTGYGRVNVGGQQIDYTHRVAYELAHGPIPDGLYVCHRCDNPPCINVAHLFLGTPLDNTLDAIAKGRMVPPPPGSRWKGAA